MLFPRKDEVLEIHRRMIERFGGALGVRDEGLLESALIAPANRWYYEGAGLVEARFVRWVIPPSQDAEREPS